MWRYLGCQTPYPSWHVSEMCASHLVYHKQMNDISLNPPIKRAFVRTMSLEWQIGLRCCIYNDLTKRRSTDISHLFVSNSGSCPMSKRRNYQSTWLPVYSPRSKSPSTAVAKVWRQPIAKDCRWTVAYKHRRLLRNSVRDGALAYSFPMIYFAATWLISKYW